MNEHDDCPECGEEMDTNCMGREYCPMCNGPCPYCSDDNEAREVREKHEMEGE